MSKANATYTHTAVPVHLCHGAGVYELDPGSIVQEAVAAAGGPAPDADLESINLARELQEQQHVYVPRAGEPNSPPAVSGGTSDEGGTAAGATVDINTATAAELETLPRVGPVTTQDGASGGAGDWAGDVRGVCGYDYGGAVDIIKCTGII